jgi:hypothetical protein
MYSGVNPPCAHRPAVHPTRATSERAAVNTRPLQPHIALQPPTLQPRALPPSPCTPSRAIRVPPTHVRACAGGVTRQSNGCEMSRPPPTCPTCLLSLPASPSRTSTRHLHLAAHIAPHPHLASHAITLTATSLPARPPRTSLAWFTFTSECSSSSSATTTWPR